MRKDIITDHAKISWILGQCQILHLGLSNKKSAGYIVASSLWLSRRY